MLYVTPEYVFKDVTHITPEWLAQKGIRALVLDIDNTLTADRSQELPEEVAGWLDSHAQGGCKADHRFQRCRKAGAPLCGKAGPCLPLPQRQAPALCAGSGP